MTQAEEEEQQRAFRQLTLAAILALGLVYMIMAVLVLDATFPMIFLR